MKLSVYNYVDNYINNSNKIEIGDYNNNINKNDLNHYINSISHSIETKVNLKNKQISVAIYLNRNNFYILSMFATWKLGGYFIPLNVSWPYERVNSLINHCDADIVICHKDGNYQEKNALFIEDINFKSNPPHIAKPKSKPSDLCYIIYTSGSTGEPKGVMISNLSYLTYIEWTKRYFKNYKNNKRLLITAELTFDITMGDLAFAFAFGTSIYVAPDPKNIISTIKMIQKNKIDTFYSVPTTHTMIFNLAKRKKSIDLSSIKLILSGGDSFPINLVKTIKEILPNTHFYNVYGPTEVTINCFACRLDHIIPQLEKNGIPIGYSFDCIDHVLINEETLKKDRNQGLLCVSGPQVMLGYFDDEQLTQNSFIKDPRYPNQNKLLYKTGDIVRQDSSKLTYIVGRNDDLVKIQGYRINPNEITNFLTKQPLILEASTITYKSPDLSDSFLISYIRSEEKLDIDKLMKMLKISFPSYMIPKEIILLSTFPLNNSGKINKKLLLKKYIEKKDHVL